MMYLRLTIVALALLGLGGCASMSAEECQVSDWRTVGYEDGLIGRSGTAIGNYRKACAKAGVQPDLAEYQAGREQGLEEFCRPQNGYRLGERGGSYQGVCPAHAEPAFLTAYNEGLTLYELRADVDGLVGDIARAEREIEQIDKDLQTATLRIISDGLSAEQRLHILADTKDLVKRKAQLEDHLDYLAEELGASRERLDDYQQMQAAVR